MNKIIIPGSFEDLVRQRLKLDEQTQYRLSISIAINAAQHEAMKLLAEALGAMVGQERLAPEQVGGIIEYMEARLPEVGRERLLNILMQHSDEYVRIADGLGHLFDMED